MLPVEISMALNVPMLALRNRYLAASSCTFALLQCFTAQTVGGRQSRAATCTSCLSTRTGPRLVCADFTTGRIHPCGRAGRVASLVSVR